MESIRLYLMQRLKEYQIALIIHAQVWVRIAL